MLISLFAVFAISFSCRFIFVFVAFLSLRHYADYYFFITIAAFHMLFAITSPADFIFFSYWQFCLKGRWGPVWEVVRWSQGVW